MYPFSWKESKSIWKEKTKKCEEGGVCIDDKAFGRKVEVVDL